MKQIEKITPNFYLSVIFEISFTSDLSLFPEAPPVYLSMYTGTMVSQPVSHCFYFAGTASEIQNVSFVFNTSLSMQS